MTTRQNEVIRCSRWTPDGLVTAVPFCGPMCAVTSTLSARAWCPGADRRMFVWLAFVHVRRRRVGAFVCDGRAQRHCDHRERRDHCFGAGAALDTEPRDLIRFVRAAVLYDGKGPPTRSFELEDVVGVAVLRSELPSVPARRARRLGGRFVPTRRAGPVALTASTDLISRLPPLRCAAMVQPDEDH